MIFKNQVLLEKILFKLNLSNYSEKAAKKIKLHYNYFKAKRLQLNFNIYAKSGIPLKKTLHIYLKKVVNIRKLVHITKYIY
jgi:hypothetical protein